MLAQAIVQFLTEAALFAVTDGEDFAFQSASFCVSQKATRAARSRA